MDRRTRAIAFSAAVLMTSIFTANGASAAVQSATTQAVAAAPNSTIYVVDGWDHAIGTVTLTTGGPVVKRNFAVLPGALSNGIVFDHSGNLVLVMSQPNGSGGLASVDSGTGALLKADITTASLGVNDRLAMDPSTDNVYIADTGWTGVSRVNTTTGALQNLNPDNLNQLSGITFTPDRRLFIVAYAGVVSELDPETGHVLHSLTIGSTIEGLTFDPTRGTLFTSNGNCQQLCELAIGTQANPALSLIRTYPNAFHSLAADGQGNIYYANGGLYRYGLSDGSNTLLVQGLAQWAGGFGSVDAIAPLVGAGSKPQAPATVLTAGPRIQVSATEGKAFTGTVGSLSDSNPSGTAADFSATIDWGDGTGASSATVTGPNGGPFAVDGTHTYSEEGNYSVQASVKGPGGASVALPADATVADAPLAATGAQQLYSTATLSNPTLATFTDADPAAPLSDFTASIDWGDGTTGTGTVSQLPSGAFAVSGSHTYAATGPQKIVTTVKDRGGSTATAAAPLLVYGVTSGGDFVISSQGYANGTATFWSPKWSSLNPVNGGPAPPAFKGFESSASGVVPAGSSWTTSAGAQATPPAQIPQYLAVIVTDSVSKDGSLLSGNVAKTAVVKADPGYGNTLDSPGTGTVVALLN